MEPWLTYLLGAVSVWRITHLLHAEDGPGDIFARFRRLLGTSFFGRAMDCFYCLSLWVALPFAFALGRAPGEYLLLWWSLSGAAILLERSTAPGPPFYPPNQFEEK
jgi:hypothetical protein